MEKFTEFMIEVRKIRGLKTVVFEYDNFMDDLSTNAIANKVITTAIQEMQETIGNIDVMLLEIIG